MSASLYRWEENGGERRSFESLAKLLRMFPDNKMEGNQMTFLHLLQKMVTDCENVPHFVGAGQEYVAVIAI